MHENGICCFEILQCICINSEIKNLKGYLFAVKYVNWKCHISCEWCDLL